MYYFLSTLLLIFSINAFALEGDHYNDLSTFPKWQSVLKKEPLPHAEYHIVVVTDMVQINDKINHSIKFKDDSENNWQTPSETKKKGTGNCKDYAALKYYELVRAGIHPDDMLIVVGKYIPLAELHAVLQVTLEDGNVYILDNLSDSIIPAKEYYKNKFQVAYGINNTRWTRTPLEEK